MNGMPSDMNSFIRFISTPLFVCYYYIYCNILTYFLKCPVLLTSQASSQYYGEILRSSLESPTTLSNLGFGENISVNRYVRYVIYQRKVQGGLTSLLRPTSIHACLQIPASPLSSSLPLSPMQVPYTYAAGLELTSRVNVAATFHESESAFEAVTIDF